MSKLNQQTKSRLSGVNWAWLAPLLATVPLAIGGAACSNSGVVGDDCPATEDCSAAGSSGSGSSAGTSSKAGESSSSSGTGNSSGGASSAGGSASTAGTGAGGTSVGETCGGIAAKACRKDWYCNFPPTAQCGAADQSGFCVPKPVACDLVYAPVCGCDGMTYGNACAAASEGISVASEGECSTGGGTCGGRGGGTCATTEYCKYAPSALCGRADATGTCTKIVKDVGCLANYDPVCGCDGMTYGNECEATRVGVSVDHAGECASAGTCGGFTGAQCSAGYFCNYPLNMACGNADGQGACTAIPMGCTKELDQVCGCDGKQYNNPCLANAAGTSVANKGACK